MKVLLAIDGSPCSNAAVTEVTKRQWPDGTEIKILSAVRVPIPSMPDPLLIMHAAYLDAMEHERKRLIALVERTASRLRDAETTKDLQIQTEVIDGSPKDVIVEEAERWGADLVILGCHGYGNIKRFLLGSVSQAVAMHAPCSVQIVRTRHLGEQTP